jgi:hypothetical protein
MNAAEKAAEVLAATADQSVIDQAELLVLTGSHVWVFDGYVDGVVALVRVGTNTADLIVYTTDFDFEESADFWAR